ncbi:NAD(P)-dependent oxidoreductase [uncultured Parasphingopyxis sp.]|uniref:DUF1932 domain-containing protein n=1 Tax=uncultured Parasphingopyxis sp. TaxID=1547918 RepID=UPI00262C68B7|nr:NAD(P)-dependent oxidoreductase [uncultured Parasphingopyxis sp.]
MNKQLALIGFGEAGETFATAAQWGKTAVAFDIDRAREHAIEAAGLSVAGDRAAALGGTPLAFSLVTADSALAAAHQCAAEMGAQALWCDMNSVAPDTKRRAAKAIEAAGGRYVDVAILAPVRPGALQVPLLVSGAAAEDACARLSDLGFANVRAVGDAVGQASAIKMIRSVMVKGIEALTDEMMAAAEAAGVAEEVLASLDASERGDGWATRAAYNRKRMRVHGARRSAEMEEAAATLSALGVDPVMTRGTVARQRAAAGGKREERDAA